MTECGGSDSDHDSSRRHRPPLPVPVHELGMYRADGHRSLTASSQLGDEQQQSGVNYRHLAAVYDPHCQHDFNSIKHKTQRSGDSSSRGSQPDYVCHVQYRSSSDVQPATCASSCGGHVAPSHCGYNWPPGSSGNSSCDSHQLYVDRERMRAGGRVVGSFCGVCFSVSVVLVIAAVIAVVSVAAYLGMETADDSQASLYEMVYKGEFTVSRGDVFHPSLANVSSQEFIFKADQYRKMLEAVYASSYLSRAIRSVSVDNFTSDTTLTVLFNVRLDRRKIPPSVLNTEQAVSDVLTQEVMSLQPRALRGVIVDIDSVRISRDDSKTLLKSSVVADATDDSRSQAGEGKADEIQPVSRLEPEVSGEDQLVENETSLTDFMQETVTPSNNHHMLTNSHLSTPSSGYFPHLSLDNLAHPSDGAQDVRLSSQNLTGKQEDEGHFKLSMQVRGMINPKPITYIEQSNQMAFPHINEDLIQTHSQIDPNRPKVDELWEEQTAPDKFSVSDDEDETQRMDTDFDLPPQDDLHALLHEKLNMSQVSLGKQDEMIYEKRLDDLVDPFDENIHPQIASDLGALLAAGVPYGEVGRMGELPTEAKSAEADYLEINVASDYGQSATPRAQLSHFADFPDNVRLPERLAESVPLVYDSSPWNPVIPLLTGNKYKKQVDFERQGLDNIGSLDEYNQKYFPSGGEPTLLNKQVESYKTNEGEKITATEQPDPEYDLEQHSRASAYRLIDSGHRGNRITIPDIPSSTLPPLIVTAVSRYSSTAELDDVREKHMSPTRIATDSTPVTTETEIIQASVHSDDMQFEQMPELSNQHHNNNIKHAKNRGAVKHESTILTAGKKLIELLSAIIGDQKSEDHREITTEKPITQQNTPDNVAQTSTTSRPNRQKHSGKPTLRPVVSYSGLRNKLRSRPPSLAIEETSSEEKNSPQIYRVESTNVNPPSNNQASGLVSVSSGKNSTNTKNLNLIRFLSLRYPVALANASVDSIQNMLNDPELSKRLVHPFARTNRAEGREAPNEYQRNNTKFLKLTEVLLNKTVTGEMNEREKSNDRANENMSANSKRKKRSPASPNSSMLDFLATITRVKMSSKKPYNHSDIGELRLVAFPLENTKPPGLNVNRQEYSKNADTFRNPDSAQRQYELNDQELLSASSTRYLSKIERAEKMKLANISRPTKLPNSSPVHILEYDTNERVEDILNQVHAMLREKWSHSHDLNHDTKPSHQPENLPTRTSSSQDHRVSSMNMELSETTNEILTSFQHALSRDEQPRAPVPSANNDWNILQHNNTATEACGGASFTCVTSGSCVSLSAVCDGRDDCSDGSDERACVALMSRDASSVSYESDAGLVMVRSQGRWTRYCARADISSDQQLRLASSVCSALSYDGVDQVHTVSVAEYESRRERKEQLNQPGISLQEHDQTFRGSDGESPHDCSDDGSHQYLYVKCLRVTCGQRPARRQPRIVGGDSVSPGDWPWYAAMYRGGQYQCGATLVTTRWLVSAAHCYHRFSLKQWVARLGAHWREDNITSSHEQLRVVSHIISHPHYVDVGFVNDIALLRLQQAVVLTDYVRPSCISSSRADVVNGRTCTVIGWGQLNEFGTVFPETLHEVQLPLITSAQCRSRTASLAIYRVTEQMFCAGFERGGRDACLGDSGGPLLCQSEGGGWSLTGVTSNGYGCARAGRPGVYTRVSAYTAWIEAVMNAPLPPPRTTYCHGHTCPLGTCLSRSQVCDGVTDCSDASDELNCQFQ